jgi:tetratricopeptide (TPR) repeat protein
MNKENFLFLGIGLLAGLIVGFVFANSVNQQAVATGPGGAADMRANSNIPPGHPEIPAGASLASMQTNLQPAIDKGKASPNDYSAQMAAGQAAYQMEKFPEAIAFFAAANKLKPDEREPMVNLGNANFDASNYDEAEKWYTAALAKKSDDVNVRTDLGLTFVFREPPNYDRAIQEFNKSLQTNPAHVQTLQNLTVAYTKKGDGAQARATLAKLESADPTNVAISKLKEDLQKLGS